jgi:hypothetical protein
MISRATGLPEEEARERGDADLQAIRVRPLIFDFDLSLGVSQR